MHDGQKIIPPTHLPKTQHYPCIPRVFILPTGCSTPKFPHALIAISVLSLFPFRFPFPVPFPSVRWKPLWPSPPLLLPLGLPIPLGLPQLVTPNSKTKTIPKRACAVRLAFGGLVVNLDAKALAGRLGGQKKVRGRQSAAATGGSGDTASAAGFPLPTAAL